MANFLLTFHTSEHFWTSSFCNYSFCNVIVVCTTTFCTVSCDTSTLIMQH